MGVLDHKRTFQYESRATPEECVNAFTEAFSARGGMSLVKGAKWAVQRTATGAVARYEGRSGLIGAASMMSRTASHEADTAIGSEMTFEVTGTDGGTTSCSMWLSQEGRAGIGGMFGSTADGRFMRPYMRAVGKKLREVDPEVVISKG